jgi:predicted transglutaminase-like cysteine proteinase
MRWLGIAVLATFAALSFAAEANSASATSALRQPIPRQYIHLQASGTAIPASSYAPVGGPTPIPHGWIDFCGRRPEECKVPALPAVDVVLTPKIWRVLDRVNREVNAYIIPVSNFDHWGTMVDHWDYPVDGKGDCKIYALYKRKLLMEAGFPRQALLMTIVRDLHGEGHAILTVKTDKGDYILDNLVNTVRPWDVTGYDFFSRQSQENPNVWLAIGSQAVMIAQSH